jgi:tryptophan synthase alpha chain
VPDVDGGTLIETAIRNSPGPAICAYLMAGYPTLEEFPELLEQVGREADLVEIGVPFTDPMADGLSIQGAGLTALDNGVTLSWIFDVLDEVGPRLPVPSVLMGYYNPFLAYGLDRLAARMVSTGMSGLIVPDLPPEESGPLDDILALSGIALVRLVTPVTPAARLARIAQISEGFIYAVTVTGITGADLLIPPELLDYLERVRSIGDRPVLAGFGVRQRSQVDALFPYVDGVVVGTALIDAIDRGDDPTALLAGLRPLPTSRSSDPSRA